MANTIKIKRGSNVNLPSLGEAELAFTTDTKRLYAGTTSGNKELFKDIPFPTGGRTGELLVKKSDADYDAEWQDLLNKVIYKRRIMVGDNLDNKTLLLDFSEEWAEMYKDITVAWNKNVIVFANGAYIDGTNEDGYFGSDYVLEAEDSIETIWEYGRSTNPDKYNITKENSIVTSVDVDSTFYRNFYIEDPNIRPIQIGDILGQNTRLYFVFPDNFITWDKLSQYIDTNTQSSITIIGSATGIYDMGLDVTSNPETVSTRANPGVHSVIRFYVKDDNEMNAIAYTPQTIGTETTYKNKSTYLYVNAPTTSQTSNEITSINPDFNQYILVDKRTLGA